MGSAIFCTDIVDCTDVWMIEYRGSLCLALEACESLRIASDIFGEKFQRDETMQARVLGLVHDAHPAPAQLLDDAVVRDRLPDKRVGVRHSAAILCCRLGQINESDTRTRI